MIDTLMPNVKNPPQAILAIVNERNEKITFELPECLEEIKEVHLNGRRLDEIDAISRSVDYLQEGLGQVRTQIGEHHDKMNDKHLARDFAEKRIFAKCGLIMVALSVVSIGLGSYLVHIANLCHTLASEINESSQHIERILEAK